MRYSTFIYDDAGIVIDYVCRHMAANRECSPYCARQDMIDWANSLGRVARSMVGKRNLHMGADANIETLARQRNGH